MKPRYPWPKHARSRHAKPGHARRLDVVLTIVAVLFLATLFILGGGPNAALRAYSAPDVVLDGQFDEWTDAPSWADSQNLPGANTMPGEPGYDPNDEPWDQKEIQYVEDIQTAMFIENSDGLWFKLDRWAKNGRGISQPVYYAVYFDMDADHPTPHQSIPGEEWYERFVNYGEDHDWVLYCAFDPEEDSSEMCHVYLVRADYVIPADPTTPPSTWPDDIEDHIAWEAYGAWGEPYDKKTKMGGLSVEFGIPAAEMLEHLGVAPGSPGGNYQFFFGATLNDPLNKGFYPQQDFCPDFYDISRFDIPTLGWAGSAILVLLGSLMAYGALRRKTSAAGAPKAEP